MILPGLTSLLLVSEIEFHVIVIFTCAKFSDVFLQSMKKLLQGSLREFVWYVTCVLL